MLRNVLTGLLCAWLALIPPAAHAQTGSAKTTGALNTETNTNAATGLPGGITATGLRQIILDVIASYPNTTSLPVTTGAWSAFTPAVFAGSGTFTTLGTTSARFAQAGKTVFFYLSVTITTNGSASGYVGFNLPVAPSGSIVGYGRAAGVSLKMLQVVGTTPGQAAIANYDNSYPGANGEVLIISGTYEAL